MNKKRILHFGIILLITACAGIEEERNFAKKFRDHIYYGRCEEAQKSIPLEKDNTSVLRFYQGSLGYLLTVTTLPITVATDILLMSRCRFGCPNEKNKRVMEVLFPTTSWTYEATKNARCPDNSYYIHKFLEISECYEKRGDPQSLKEAQDQLSFLYESYDSPLTCIQVRDGQIIKKQLRRVKKKQKANKV